MAGTTVWDDDKHTTRAGGYDRTTASPADSDARLRLRFSSLARFRRWPHFVRTTDRARRLSLHGFDVCRTTALARADECAERQRSHESVPREGRAEQRGASRLGRMWMRCSGGSTVTSASDLLVHPTHRTNTADPTRHPASQNRASPHETARNNEYDATRSRTRSGTRHRPSGCRGGSAGPRRHRTRHRP